MESFIGFQFGQYRNDNFGAIIPPEDPSQTDFDPSVIYRVSDSDRYNIGLNSQISDKTAEIPALDGAYLFNTTLKPKVFRVSFAFDCLTDIGLRALKRWFNGKSIEPLIFDEEPYKVYDAKVTGTPEIKIITFEDNGYRIYKGEGTVEFTAYYPYAHTPAIVNNNNGKSLSSYKNYPNVDEWKAASGLTDTFKLGENKGDIPTFFIVTPKDSAGVNLKKGEAVLIGGDLSIVVAEDCTFKSWNSKTGIVKGIATTDGSEQILNVTGNIFGRIPTYGFWLDENFAKNYNLEYDYWYY